MQKKRGGLDCALLLLPFSRGRYLLVLFVFRFCMSFVCLVWVYGACFVLGTGRRWRLGYSNLTTGFHMALRKTAGWGQDLGLRNGCRKTSSYHVQLGRKQLDKYS